MSRLRQPRMTAAIVVLALGLVGCVAYEPAPAYYYGPPNHYQYYGPSGYYRAPGYAYGSSYNYAYRYDDSLSHPWR